MRVGASWRTPEGDPMKITSEIAIRSTPLEDVYVAISGFSQGGDVASFEMHVNPFTLWVWIGGVVLVGSVIICLWPERVRVRAFGRVRGLQPALGGRKPAPACRRVIIGVCRDGWRVRCETGNSSEIP